MATWEYKSISLRTKGGVLRSMNFRDDLAEQCNSAGREGWELVSAVPLDDIRGRTDTVCLMFKRSR